MDTMITLIKALSKLPEKIKKTNLSAIQLRSCQMIRWLKIYSFISGYMVDHVIIIEIIC